MFRSTLGFVPEDEVAEDQSTMFGGLRKKLAHEFAAENSGFPERFERLKVYLRVRPFTPEEVAASKQDCLLIEDDCVTAIAPKDSNTFKNSTHANTKGIHKFKFSKIFRESTSQLEFYDGTIRSLVDDFLMGQNCLVYAYGVTNAGKTYTVQGSPQNPGLLPRTLETIFTHVNGKQWPGLDLKPKMFVDVIKLSPKSEHEERNKKDHIMRLASFDDSDTASLLADSGRESCPLEITERSQESDINEEELLHVTHLNETAYGNQIKYSVWISFAEVYNEQVFDLLEVPNLKKRTMLKLGEDKNGNPYIRGLTEVNVSSTEEALKLMKIGQKNLRKASTKLNHNSSRSHCIFNIKLLRVVNQENPRVAKVTMLSLCDLAGSERACKTNSTGDRLKEAGNINTSLLTLGRCIEMMRANQLKKDLLVPYRDSKLTRLFQGFFSGRGKAVMIVNVNKCSTLFDETLQVFKFSAIAKQVVIQQKVDKPVSIAISPVLPLSHMERASIPWAIDDFEISCANNSADETMEDELTERERNFLDEMTDNFNYLNYCYHLGCYFRISSDVTSDLLQVHLVEFGNFSVEFGNLRNFKQNPLINPQGLLEIIDTCKGAVKYLKECLANEKKERMLDEIRLRDEITKELMEEFVAIEKKYSERMQYHQLQAEEANDSKINKMLANLNSKKRSHEELEEEMVPLHVLQESQNKIEKCELEIQELTQRLESMKKQMRRMTNDTSKLACEKSYLQFQVSDMLRVPTPQKGSQSETLSDNLEQANVLNKLTGMLTTTQEKLKEKQNEVCELEEQLQEAGETFHQNQKELDELNQLVKQLEETNQNPPECLACKVRSESSWQFNPGQKSQAGFEEGKGIYQKFLTDFEEREQALINGYNAEISKYKAQISQLRLQLAHTKSPASRSSQTKDATPKGKESVLNQAKVKHYLLRQVKRLQDELDRNSQSVAEVHHALELKKEAEIDREHRLASETAGHRQVKVLISELKTKVKRLGERCRSASFEAEKTFAAIESELSVIENTNIPVKEDISEQESFQSATENSFDLPKMEPNKENHGLVRSDVVKDAASSPAKNTKKVFGENGSFLRLDPKCLEQKIVNKNNEIVRLQEKLLIQSKLERDVKDLNKRNEELTQKVKETSQLEMDLKKKSLHIRNLEDKLKNEEVFEVKAQSQVLIIQHLEAAVNERDVLLAKLKDVPSRPNSNEGSPVSTRKLEEMEMVIVDLREMVDVSTKDLSQKDEKIEALASEKKSLKESLEQEFQLLKTSIDSLETELQSLKKEKEALEVLKKMLIDELETLKLENDTISESRNSLTKDLEISKKEAIEISHLKNLCEKNLESLKLENKTINDLKNSLLKDMENLKLENKTINDLKNSLLQDLENLKLENKTINDSKNSLKKDLEISKTETKTVLDLKNSLTKEFETLKTENELISSLKTSLEKDLKNCEEKKEKVSGALNSLEIKFQILKEENVTILKEKESLLSEADSKSLEMASLKSSHLSKESADESSKLKARNELTKSLALAKMAQKELEENLETKKKELRAKDAELTKISKLLEEKNQENLDLESKIIDPHKDQDAAPNKVTELTGALDLKNETNGDSVSGNVGTVKVDEISLSQEEKIKSLQDEVKISKKSLNDNVEVRDKLLIEISGLVSLLAEKDSQIEKLTNECHKHADDLSDNGETSVAQLKAVLNTEKERCEKLTIDLDTVTTELNRLKSERDIKSQVELDLNIQSSQDKTAETIEKGDNDEKEKTFMAEKELNDAFSEGPATQTLMAGVDAENVLQAELQNVKSLLETERSTNATLRCELEATNSRISELKTDYDNEKNVSFTLKYELDDVKGSLNEVFDSLDQMKLMGKDVFIKNKQDKEMDEKELEDLTPETREIVQGLKTEIKSWQAKYEELSSQLISERQKLLDAQHSQSENFYLRRERDELRGQLSNSQKELQELESRQQIQLITLETDQMTKKLIEDRKKSEEQNLRNNLDHLRKELDTAKEKVKSYEQLEAEVKHLQEKVVSLEAADKTQTILQQATDSEVRLDEKFKYEGLKKNGDEELKEKSGDDKDVKRLGYEEMRKEVDIMSKELAAAQKEVQCLRDQVKAKSTAPSTPLFETKVGSNRLLRRDKIQAETARMEAEFALKIAQDEIRSLVKKLEKFERKVSVGTTRKRDSVFALEAAQKEILQLKGEVEESEAKISAAKSMTATDMSQELKNLQKEKMKVSKLEDDLDKKKCAINVLKDTLKEQENIMIEFEKALSEKDETIKNLNVELSESKNLLEKEKESVTTSTRPSLEKEQLKTVVSNQTETIQVLSQRNTEQELNCGTIRNELQDMKLSLSIITSERDSLRKRLHLAETSAVGTCKCSSSSSNNGIVTLQTGDIDSPQPLSDTVKENENMVANDSAVSSDKQVCLSPASDESSPPPSSPALPREEYIEIDVTPPVAAKALKRNRKRKPFDSPTQNSHLNSSKLSISSLSLCRRANVSDESDPSGQKTAPETDGRRPSRHCKLIAQKKLKQLSDDMSQVSPLNKRKKSVEAEKTPISSDPISDVLSSKGKTPLSRIKSLTSSFRSSSFRGAKNLLTNTRSLKESPKKDVLASPSTFYSSSISKRTDYTVNTSNADTKKQHELNAILSSATTSVGFQRKRRLYKEEILGPMSYESQIMKTRAITTVRPREDVYSIVNQQIKNLKK